MNDMAGETARHGRTAVYAPVSSADQKADLDRQVARVTALALDGHRRKFLAKLCDPSVDRIVVEHRDRFCGFGSEYVQSALAARGREMVVIDPAEFDDDPGGRYDRVPHQ